MKLGLICFLLACGAVFCQGQEASKMHELKVADGFNYQTSETVNIRLDVFGMQNKKSIYRLYGKAGNQVKDLLCQNFLPEETLFLQTEIPLHFDRLILEVTDGNQVRSLNWQKAAFIVDFIELDMPKKETDVLKMP